MFGLSDLYVPLAHGWRRENKKKRRENRSYEKKRTPLCMLSPLSLPSFPSLSIHKNPSKKRENIRSLALMIVMSLITRPCPHPS